MREWLIALTFLTRLPLPVAGQVTEEDIGRSCRYYPLVGALVGASIGAVYHGFSLLFPPMLAATLAATFGVILTGAFHEDALGDVADGFGGGITRERKLEIMKDSRHGTYGVLAMVLAMLLRILAIAVLPPMLGIFLLAAVHALSRVGVVWMLWKLPSARPVGVGARAQHAGGREALIATGLGLVVAGVLLGVTGVFPLIAMVLGSLVVARLSLEQIGGITGDVLGTAQQVSELFALLSLVAIATHPAWGFALVAPWLR